MGAERRKEKRQLIPYTVYYSCMGEEEHLTHKVAALQLNVSGSGMCIFTSGPLLEGASVDIFHTPTDSSPKNKASVKWCNKISKNLFKAGLLFAG